MWFLAIRHLRDRPLQTTLTFIGIVLGSAAYVMFSGMMLGFQEQIIDLLVNVDAQIRISARDEAIEPGDFDDVFFPGAEVLWHTPPHGRSGNRNLSNVRGWFDRLEADARVAAYAPQLARDALIAHRGRNANAMLIGVDPVDQSRVTVIGDYFQGAELEDLSGGTTLVVVGKKLLEQVGARTGDTVRMATAGGRTTAVKILGAFDSGTQGFDDVIVYASLETVQQITGEPGQISDVIVRLDDVGQTREVAAEWARYSRDKVESWEMAHADLLTVFTTQDIVRNTISFIIIVVVGFGIFNVLNMAVTTKQREIAILRSVGYDAHDTARLFMYQGLLLGLAGATVGLSLGAAGCAYMSTIEFSGMRGDTLAIAWNPSIYANAFLLSFGSAVLAAYLPARAAGRLTPIEIIRMSA